MEFKNIITNNYNCCMTCYTDALNLVPIIYYVTYILIYLHVILK